MYSFPVTGDAHCPDGECILDTGSGNHVGIGVELCIAIALSKLPSVTYTYVVLCSIFYISPINQKSGVTSAICRWMHKFDIDHCSLRKYLEEPVTECSTLTYYREG